MPRDRHLVDDVRHLSKADQKIIIRDAGVEVPGGMDAKTVMLMAMSFVNMAWHKAEGTEVPFVAERRHNTRLQLFKQDVEHVKRHGPIARQKKEPIQMEIPGTPEPTADPREILQ